MSGGFFRGTSADQDTRFSNKQAKLLKSQKFAPELENLVDMTKVKMDVMKPWIAKRVTELIGFEDEVLINFIYGLLEGEAVNGKQVQISLTGFMERNTGKFMKELWSLLISAQQNVSGVPQQFLDAKEEEAQRKKAETDRIANEIHRKKEKEKLEFQEEKAKMDGYGAKSRVAHSELEPNAKRDVGGSTIQKADEKERYKRNGRRRSSRDSRSPDSPPPRSPSSRRKHSVSPSKSESRSYSKSRSTSGVPPSRSRSISSERRDHSLPRRSMTPRRRHASQRSPSPRHISRIKRRSRSHSRRRSPSPAGYRFRSPRHHRSRSPLRRRSRSPVRRRSRTPMRRPPIRYRSRTPVQRRSPSPVLSRSSSPIRGRSPAFERRRIQSPVRRRSPSPARRRSPSPVRRRSPPPLRRRSPPPLRRRSPSPVRRRSRSPMRRRSPLPQNRSPSPARRRFRRSLSTSSQRSVSPRQRSSIHGRKRSLSPVSRRSPSPRESSSPSHTRHGSLSPVRRRVRSPIKSPGERVRRLEKYSPARRASPSERAETYAVKHKGIKSAERKPVISLRSPQRDVPVQSDVHGKQRNLSPSLPKSPSESDSSRGRSHSDERRSISPRVSPHQRRGRIVPPDSPNPSQRATDHKTRHDNSRTSVDDKNNLSKREIGGYKNKSSEKSSQMPVSDKGSHDTDDIHHLADDTKLRGSHSTYSDKPSDTADHNELRERQEFSSLSKTADVSVKNREYDDATRADKDKKIAQAEDDKESGPKLSREQNDKNGLLDSPLKGTDERGGSVKEKRKKKSDRQGADSDDCSSYDSYEERKEAKKRRKEERKLKKESRRRRRHEKRRRRDERRAEKLKLKSGDASSSSSDQSEEESIKRQELQSRNIEETVSEQKRLEIELREKALKSLRAKKGVGN